MLNFHPYFCLMIGLILLLLSGLCYWRAEYPHIREQDQILCIQQLKDHYAIHSNPEWIELCNTSVGFIAKIKTQSQSVYTPDDITQAIIQANQEQTQKTILMMSLAMLFLILGGLISIKAINIIVK